jgi:hypothetical protein
VLIGKQRDTDRIRTSSVHPVQSWFSSNGVLWSEKAASSAQGDTSDSDSHSKVVGNTMLLLVQVVEL